MKTMAGAITDDMNAGRGWLLVGHGTREQRGIDEFRNTTEHVSRSVGSLAVEPALLEFARPTISEGFESLVARGARQVTVVPVLLFSAGHAQRDIPRQVAAVAARHPHVEVVQAEHLGCHDAILELSRQRFHESIVPAGSTAPQEMALVMVGRGSRDRAATAEMRRFVDLRRNMTPVAHAAVSFLAMAEPTLESALAQISACGAKRFVVQPHLLFGGLLVDRIVEKVSRFAVRHSHAVWLVGGHLGPDRLLAEAIISRAREATCLSARGQRVAR